MAKMENNSIYVITNMKTSEDFLALSNFQDYFYNGDFLSLVEMLTQKDIDEGGLREFQKINFALYNQEFDELTPLSKRYSVKDCLGDFGQVLNNFLNAKDKLPKKVPKEKIEVFLQNMLQLN